MEQGNRLDSTPVSAAQAVRDDAGEDRALNAAITALLRSPLKDVAPSVTPDPILSAIAENRRLQMAVSAASKLPQPVGTIDPLPEQVAAMGAAHSYANDVLLTTVPTTAAGCAALARYAVEFQETEGFALDENTGNDQHVRVLDLIARSSMQSDCPSPSPALVDMVAEWQRLLDLENTGQLNDEEMEPICTARVTLHSRICTFPVASLANLAAKLPLFRDEIVNSAPSNPEKPTLDYQAWCCIVRDLEAMDGVQAGNIGGSAATQRASAEAVDLSRLDISALCAFYEAAGVAREMWNGAMCLPIAVASGGVAGGFVIRTPFGDLASFEDGRLGNLRDRIVAEAEHRTPADRWDRDNLLSLRIQHELACEGRIRAPALLADIAQTWAPVIDASSVGGSQR